MDLIRIRGLELDCIVGIRPFEREREQRVHLDIALGMDLSKAGRAGRIALTCDYSEVADEVIAMLRFRRYQLIEMATEEVAAMLLGTHPAVEMVEVRLDKPGALDGRARVASVEIQRTRASFPTVARHGAAAKKETLLETREAGLYLLRVEPGERVVAGEGPEYLEWSLSGELWRDGSAVLPHVPTVTASGGVAYENVGTTPALLFRCICPTGLDD
jgi:dihydroneopterin aldolase